MKSWVLTGGVATGKSLVGQLIERLLGLHLRRYSCDDAVVSAFEDPILLATLKDALGDRVLGAAGGVDRGWIREHVLPNAAKRARLESIVHPVVFSGLDVARGHARKEGANLFVAEVPLHYETGASVSADLIIVVAASRSVQVRRMMENRGLDEHSVHSFLDAQWPIEAKAERADVVIWNDGDIPALEAQVSKLSTYLRQS